MTYAYPSNVTGIYDLVLWCGTVTSGWFVPAILIGLFVILFMAFKSYPTERAFGASSFITMLITIMLGSVGLVSDKFLIGAIVIGAIGAVVLYISNHKEYG